MAGMLKIIAEKAGLSQSTVSQILNRKPNDFSSEETRQRVFAIAKELGYKQKFGHKLLRGDKTKTAGILLGMHRLSLEEHMQLTIMQLLDKLELKGYGTYLVTLADDEEKNIKTVKELINRGVDCFIVIGAPSGEPLLEQEILKHKKTLIGHSTHLHRNIRLDSSVSCEKIVRFFFDNGKTNFRLFSDHLQADTRWQGLKNVFPELDDEELETRYVHRLGPLGEHDDMRVFSDIGYAKTKEALANDPDIQGFIYLSDYFAIGGVRCLAEMGKKIGTDLLVAGFNNIHAVRTHFLPITSTCHDVDEVTDCMLAEMEKSGDLNKVIYTEPIIRK